MPDTSPPLNTDRILGGVLIGAGFLTVLALLHHPVVNAGTAQGAIEELAREAPLNRAVHGGAILVMLIQLYGFMAVRHRSAGGEAAPNLSVMLFAAGAGAMVGAALISGFVLPMLASFFAGGDLTGFRGLARLTFAGNQALAGFGSVALAAAGLVSVWPLWRAGGWLKLVAATGAGLGLMTVLILMVSDGIDVTAMTLIAIGLSLWSASMGIYLIMRKA